VEILQHRFNIEKMVKIAEILLTYSDEGETCDLQVFGTTTHVFKKMCDVLFTLHKHKAGQDKTWHIQKYI